MVKNRILWTLLTGSLALAATGTQAQTIATWSEYGAAGLEQRRTQPTGAAVGHRRLLVWHHPTGLKQLITFHADGTVFRSVPGEASIDPARPPHTPTHGVWRYLGNRQFGATMWDIFYDITTGQLLHYMKIRLHLTLDDDRDEASATALLEVIDPQVLCCRLAGAPPPTCSSRSSRWSRPRCGVATRARGICRSSRGLVPVLGHGSRRGTGGGVGAGES